MSEDLVQADSVPADSNEKVTPPAQRLRIPMQNLLELHAREQAGLPDDWRMFQWEVKGAKYQPTYVPGTHTAITGIVVTKRKRNGEWSWRSGDNSTQMTITLRDTDHKKWCEAWGLRNDVCYLCQGNGDVVRSFGEKGVTYCQCPKCKGSGKPSAGQVTFSDDAASRAGD